MCIWTNRHAGYTSEIYFTRVLNMFKWIWCLHKPFQLSWLRRAFARCSCLDSCWCLVSEKDDDDYQYQCVRSVYLIVVHATCVRTNTTSCYGYDRKWSVEARVRRNHVKYCENDKRTFLLIVSIATCNAAEQDFTFCALHSSSSTEGPNELLSIMSWAQTITPLEYTYFGNV